MEWIKFSKHNPPHQGLKIVCFRQGDLWVARRINYEGKDYYLEIPYGGKSGAISTDIPDYWMQLELPEGYRGQMYISVDGGDRISLDELQRIDPLSHEEFAEIMLSPVIKKTSDGMD